MCTKNKKTNSNLGISQAEAQFNDEVYYSGYEFFTAKTQNMRQYLSVLKENKGNIVTASIR